MKIIGIDPGLSGAIAVLENNKVLKPGDVSEHRSNQPHAMRTHNLPIMAYVIWRNHFDTPPVWTDYLNNSNQN